MSSLSLDRRLIEEHWQQRLKDARLQLTATRRYVKEVQQEFPLAGKIQGADGTYAYRRALKLENHALAKYSSVLRIYADVVLHDKTPGDGAGSVQ